MENSGSVDRWTLASSCPSRVFSYSNVIDQLFVAGLFVRDKKETTSPDKVIMSSHIQATN